MIMALIVGLVKKTLYKNKSFLKPFRSFGGNIGLKLICLITLQKLIKKM